MNDPSDAAPENTTAWGVADDGAVVEVTLPAGATDRLDPLWPPLGLVRHETAPAGAPAALQIAVLAGTAGTLRVEVDGLPSPGGWDRVESELALFAAERLAGLVAIHAAAVAHQGSVILVPGPTGTGKSRFSAAADGAGATVLTDEYALVDPTTGLVTGWTRPVRIRRPGGGVDRLDLARSTPPLPVGLVASVFYVPGAEATLEDMSAATTTMALLSNTVCAKSRPGEALDAALAIARTAQGVRGVRGDAPAAVAVLLDRLAVARAAADTEVGGP